MPKEDAACGRGAIGLQRAHAPGRRAKLNELADACDERGFKTKFGRQIDREDGCAARILTEENAGRTRRDFLDFRPHPDKAAICRSEWITIAQHQDQHIVARKSCIQPGIVLAVMRGTINRLGSKRHVIGIGHMAILTLPG